MAQEQRSFWRGRRWPRWVAGGLLATLAVVAGIVTLLMHRAEPFLRARLLEALEQRFHARVELDNFHLSLGNGLHGEWGVWAEGLGLRIWPSPAALGAGVTAEAAQSLAATEPLIRLESFRFHAPLRYRPGQPLRISLARIAGLVVHVPPRQHKPDPGQRGQTTQGGQEIPDATPPPAAGESTGTTKPQPVNAGILTNAVVERIECDRAQLVLETNKPDKLPLGFAIAHLVLTGVTANGPVGFEADLTNPRPLGQIHSTGKIGPWQADDPGATPVSGDYRFEHADMSGFKGIAGTLNSTGHCHGTLRDIAVEGETDTPDFRLTEFGNPMPLHTRFQAKVDGTDGDTWLDPVDATLGNSHFTVKGSVVRFTTPEASASAGDANQTKLPGSVLVKESPFRGGHEITFSVDVDRARIEDFLHLAGRSKMPLLTGPVTMKAMLRISPGEESIRRRLRISGVFHLSEVHFSSAKIQDRVEQLSLRGQGRHGDMKTMDPRSVGSSMQGDFQMAEGVITLPGLTYTVPGATIQLKGTYGVEGGTLDFAGTARMQATVSEMVGGWKGFLLKPVDRYFKGDGAGTQVPIHVTGTREEPKFGVDLERMKRTSPERQGDSEK